MKNVQTENIKIIINMQILHVFFSISLYINVKCFYSIKGTNRGN